MFSNPRKANVDELEQCFGLLMEAGADVNCINSQGDTSLLKAIRQGHEKGVELLLKQDALNLMLSHTTTGNNCVHEACFVRKPNILKVLLESGASVDEQNNNGDSVLHILLQGNQGHFAFAPEESNESSMILELLGNHGVSLTIQNNQGELPLHICSGSDTQSSWMINQISDDSLLKIENNEGDNIIQKAARVGNIDRVAKLFPIYEKYNIPITLKDVSDSTNNNTILHYVSKSEEFGGWINELVEKSNCDVNAVNIDGNTPLHIACSCDNADSVSQLLKNGASVDIENNCGKKAIDIVLENVSVGSIFQFLKEKEGIFQKEQLESIKDGNGESLLHRAVAIGHFDLVRELIELGVDVNVSMYSEDGFEDDGTPLHFAARTDNPIIMDLLLGVPSIDINSNRNFRKNTALHIAADMGHTECVKLLVRKPNIQFDLLNNDGNSPLDCANEGGCNQCPSIIEIAMKEKNMANELASSLPTVLIIGSGFVGNRLSKLLSSVGFSVIETHRSVQNPNSVEIAFNFDDEITWKNLPKKVDWIIITFAIKNLELFKKLYEQYLRNASDRIIVYGSTSRYDIGTPNQEVTEDTDINLSIDRVQCEEYAREQGAAVLVLVGITGEQRQPRRWFQQGRIKNGNKFVNLVHVSDILSCTLWCMNSFDEWKGKNINVTDGEPKWMADLFTYFGYPVLELGPQPVSKKILHGNILKCVPNRFSFINLLQ